MTYYPPPMGYGQAPYGYHPYAAQPPPPMYNAPAYAGPYRPAGRCSNCFRSFVLFILMLLLWYFVLVMIASFNFDDDPFYTVDTFSVSNFSTSNSTLTSCIWDAKINVTNPTSNTNVSFTDFMVHVFYNDEEVVQSQEKSLEVGQDQTGQLEMRAEYNPGVQPQQPNSTVDEMAKDRATGWLKFSLVLTAKAVHNYESSLFVWTLKQKLSAQCRDLRVQFVNNTGNATFNDGGDHVRCPVVLHY